MFGKKPMSDLEKKAKLAALGDANKLASDALKGNLSGLKKVTVASDSKQGLQKGLDKAEDLLGHPEESELSGEGLEASPEECPSDEMEHMEKHESEMSEEELDAKIQELLELKEKLQAGEE